MNLKKIVIILLVMCICSCSTSHHFTKRRYTKGHFFARSAPVKSPGEVAGNTGKAIARPVQQTISASALPEVLSTHQSPLRLSGANTSLPVRQLEKSRSAVKNNKKSKVTYSDPQDSNLGKSSVSLVSVILSGLGMMANVAGFILVIGTSEYIFMLLFVAGFALGLAGLITGFVGMKNFKRKKREGVKHTSELVLGIVGISMGGVAMLLALYFAAFSALWLLSW